MFVAEFDRKARKWRAVAPGSGRVDVVVIEHAPAAKPGSFVNPRHVLERRNALVRNLRAAA